MKPAFSIVMMLQLRRTLVQFINIRRLEIVNN